MDNEKACIYRIVVGIIFLFSNNENTWEIVNYFANINNNLNVALISFFRTIFILISLMGLIITLINAILLLKLTMSKKKS